MEGTMLVFYGNQPCLDTTVCETPGPNFQKKYGLNRDRQPDRDWGELRNTDQSTGRFVKETPELRQILLEDLSYAYGRDTKVFTEKLKEFKFI